MKKILILGGTREATKLATKLIREGHHVTTSLAGRTREPEPIEGDIRVGGFGGPEGLARYLKEHRIDKLIDATHPFAKQISMNAKQAAAMVQIEFEAVRRAPWIRHPEDNWIEVKSLQEACDVIPSNARVMLALGSQHIGLFSARHDVFFLVRMVDQPLEPLSLPNHKLLIGKPSTEPASEMATLRQNKLDYIVCRNSGGKGAYAKIIAARNLGLPVIMVQR